LKRREQAYLNKKEGNKHILIERREQAHLDRKEGNKHILIERMGTRISA
jgi:hypothetical protein